MSAFVDINSGTIVGAKKGTKVYLHEEGHIVYNKSETGMRNSFNEQSSFQLAVYIGIFALVLPILKWFSIALILMSIYYHFFEEVWCWHYAFLKFNKEKGGKNGIQNKEDRI